MDDPMFDEHGYPLKDTLDEIATWPKSRGWGELMRFVRAAWKHAKQSDPDGGALVPLHAGWSTNVWLAAPDGWSGNEDIIAAMQENTAFWGECFIEAPLAPRPSYYKFAIPTPPAPCGDHRDCETCINREDCGYLVEDGDD
jgi:hypothetical protein